ncbi:MAG TPA: ornithine carbamoyltransferase [Acidimicrobiales bacterium]|nr:ornithine carbamoyltransferase [Acidimicrobiales bacterium]
MTRHLLSITDLASEELSTVLDLAEATPPSQSLAGKGAALVFEHPSARTRNASEMAVVQLGGHPVTIRGEEIGFDRRESVEDVAMTLASYHALIAARVTRHSVLERMVSVLDGASLPVPVINLLSDVEHPTQALADLLTIRQEFTTFDVSVGFVGDGNNVARSLAFACALAGVRFAIASPKGYELTDADCGVAESLGGEIVRHRSPTAAAEGADVLYTDVWVSMGEDAARAEKLRAFSGFSIDDDLLAVANEGAIVMHCLPAHRGEEITGDVIGGPHSRVWRQAQNRMHAMRGLLVHCLEEQG